MDFWTVNYKTLNKINRGHTLAEYLDAVLMTAPYGFEICTHIILNLPGDDMTDVDRDSKDSFCTSSADRKITFSLYSQRIKNV